MRKNNVQLELRLSREDKVRIEKAARKCGVSVKEYVLRCCKGKEVRQKPPEEFWQILGHLYGYCDNMDEEERMQLAELHPQIAGGVLKWQPQSYGTSRDGSKTS